MRAQETPAGNRSVVTKFSTLPFRVFRTLCRREFARLLEQLSRLQYMGKAEFPCNFLDQSLALRPCLALIPCYLDLQLVIDALRRNEFPKIEVAQVIDAMTNEWS